MTDAWRAKIRRVPGVRAAHQRLRATIENRKLQDRGAEDVFTSIYAENGWAGNESLSGPGSDLAQTSAVVDALPALLDSYDVGSILDLPCGDFRWMQSVQLGDRRYTGADIVGDLILDNRARYGSATRSFVELDLITDVLPTADLVLCRDCLVHLSFDDIRSSLVNLVASEATFLLTTTFTERSDNLDIATGRWRPLNLQVSPFYLPPPLDVIDERCTEGGGIYRDKTLGLWRMSDITDRVRA